MIKALNQNLTKHTHTQSYEMEWYSEIARQAIDISNLFTFPRAHKRCVRKYLRVIEIFNIAFLNRILGNFRGPTNYKRALAECCFRNRIRICKRNLYSIEATIKTFKAFHYCESNITILDLFNER